MNKFRYWLIAGLVVLLLAGGTVFTLGFDTVSQYAANVWFGRALTAADVSSRAASVPGSTHLGLTTYRQGDKVPGSFGLPDLDGKSRTLDEYRGNPVLLNFWASWCHPCRQEMPVLSQAQIRYPHVHIIGIAIDKREAIRTFLHKVPVTYPVWQGLAGDKNIPAMFGDTRGLLPYNVLLDGSGTIVRTHFGPLNADQLAQWLAP